ncbi:hypothetical protein [Dictyobacter kobayashii]|nr:hypothetical protein [Dictyobacter kobayashii]
MEQYDRKRSEENARKAGQLKSIENSIHQIDEEQKNLAARMGKTSSEKLQIMLEEQFELLEAERKKLMNTHEQLKAENSVVLKKLEEELRDLEQNWPRYPFERRITLINFLIKKVVVDVASPHWTRIEVEWLHSDWGCEYIYVFGYHRGQSLWCEEEDLVLIELYGSAPKTDIMRRLPKRTWSSIHVRAQKLKLKRPQGKAGIQLAKGIIIWVFL